MPSKQLVHSRYATEAIGSDSSKNLPTISATLTVDSGEERAQIAMDRYSNGDDSAFAEVYDTIAPRVQAYLVKQTRDPAASEDLLQQTLIQIHRHRGSYVRGLPVLPWAFAIARRFFIDEFRRRKRDALWNTVAVSEADRSSSFAPDEEVNAWQVAELLEMRLARLPDTQRTAFELLRIEGLSHDQAADRLGTTVNAIKLRAFRAYTALRAALTGET